jgi:hypothetical protein
MRTPVAVATPDVFCGDRRHDGTTRAYVRPVHPPHVRPTDTSTSTATGASIGAIASTITDLSQSAVRVPPGELKATVHKLLR